jgi:hypothetical protein
MSSRAIAYEYSLSHIRSLPSTSTAQEAALDIIATTLRLPLMFDFDTLFKLDPVAAIKDHKLFSLLQIFLNDGFSKFRCSCPTALEKYSRLHLSHPPTFCGTYILHMCCVLPHCALYLASPYLCLLCFTCISNSCGTLLHSQTAVICIAYTYWLFNISYFPILHCFNFGSCDSDDKIQNLTYYFWCLVMLVLKNSYP